MAFGDVEHLRRPTEPAADSIAGPGPRATVPAMPFPRRLLIEGEELRLDLRPHPVALFMPALYTIVVTVAVGFLASSARWSVVALARDLDRPSSWSTPSGGSS